MDRGAQPSFQPVDLVEPSRLQYRLLGKIASGGMGSVYLATHKAAAGFSRLVAIKIIHEHLAEDQRFVQMLLDEARIAGRLSHPNAVGILDVGCNRGRYYVVMPYVEGGTLTDLLRYNRQDRPPAKLIPLVIDALRGLHAAHTLEDETGEPLDLVHRDVCSSNILVGADGMARIADFGIAKAAARLTHTAPGILKGKLSYMAPEQATRGEIDARADIFSVGVVLWGALTGKALFRGATEVETMHNLLHREVPPPSECGLEPPPFFDEIIVRALARDPDDRFASAADMADALRARALEHGLLAPPSEISRWVSHSFADRLAARRSAISEAMKAPSPVSSMATAVLRAGSLAGSEPDASHTAQQLTGWSSESEPSAEAEESYDDLVVTRPGRIRLIGLALGAAVAAAIALLAIAALGGEGAAEPTLPSTPAPAASASVPMPASPSPPAETTQRPVAEEAEPEAEPREVRADPVVETPPRTRPKMRATPTKRASGEAAKRATRKAADGAATRTADEAANKPAKKLANKSATKLAKKSTTKPDDDAKPPAKTKPAPALASPASAEKSKKKPEIRFEDNPYAN